MSRTIQVDHLARVEGHGGITVTLEGQEVRAVEFDVFEGIRALEALVGGREAEEVPALLSRICAICSHGHFITSALALENALGVAVSAQTRLLRDLAFQGANIQSHALHAFVLALPDFVGQPSVLTLAAVNPEAVRMALRLKKLGNTIQEVVGGRAVHPVNYVVGGFGRLPTPEEILPLRAALAEGIADCRRALELLGTLSLVPFVKEPIRVAALVPEDEAFFFGSRVAHSSGAEFRVADYRQLTAERVVGHSHAKHSAYRGKPFMVGALARLTLHGDRLGGLAREAQERLGLTLPSDNIVANSLAQVVEMIFSVERARDIVERLLAEGLRDAPRVPVEWRAGQGTAATEVPRGTLYHHYELDQRGRVVTADVITPTAQNASHLEEQLRATVRDAPGVDDETLRLRLAMVARAYDPCISCSVHLVRVPDPGSGMG